MRRIKKLNFYLVIALLLLALLSSPVNASNTSQVYFNDFDGGLTVAPGVTDTLAGITSMEPAQGYDGLGTGSNTFGGYFLRNTTGGDDGGGGSIGTPGLPTSLTLTGLPPHSSIDINFLLAIIDSWDGSEPGGCTICHPDILTVTVDGMTVFSESFGFNNPSFVPTPGVLLTEYTPLGFNPTFDDSAYDMGLYPVFDDIPHTASSLTIEWFASGGGWQGGDDESWAIDNLEISLELEVAVDIKPGSCPNPINIDSKGTLPVAILGTDTLDVSSIDPATVQLEGVSPLRWSFEDVSTPYVPMTGKQDIYDCTMDGPDGYIDLVLKFKTQEVIAAIGTVYDGDVLVLQLTGNLSGEFGGTGFFGEDVVRIFNKIGPDECKPLTVIQSFATPAGSQPHGMAFDGSHLLVAGYNTATIYKLNMDGTMVSSFPSPGPSPTGLEFDGTYLWGANDGPPMIYKLNMSGDVLFSFTAPGTDSTGLAYDGRYLWNADFNWGIPGGYLHRIDVSNLQQITFTSYPSPGEGPEGLAYDGKYLWHVDFHNNNIYKLDLSAQILCTYPSYGTSPIGLTFDGKYLWLADFSTRMIYQIDIGK